MTLAEHVFVRNALLGRYAFSQLRPMACAISAGIYLTVAALVFILGHTAFAKPHWFDAAGFWRSMFVSFSVIQVFMLWVVGAYHAGSAVQQEIAEKSMDFFRLLPLSPAQKIVGVLVGRNVVTLALGLLNSLILAACGAAYGVRGTMLAEFVGFLWAVAAAAMLLAFLGATFESRGRLSNGPMLLLVFSVFFLPYLIGMGSHWSRSLARGTFVDFFGARLHLLAFLALLALYACVWLVVGLRRRFVNERAALFTPAGAIRFLFGFLLIGFGLTWKFFSEARMESVVVFWVSSGLAALAVAAGAFRNWDELHECARRTAIRPGLNVANMANPAVGTALLFLWGAFALVADLVAGMPIALEAVPVLMTFGLVLLFLMEFGVTHAPLTGRIRVLAGFLAGLYCVLPLILSGVMSKGFFLVFSPLGYLTQIGAQGESILAPLPANAVWLVVLGALIRHRYRAVLVPERP
jgi:hypothetical protein